MPGRRSVVEGDRDGSVGESDEGDGEFVDPGVEMFNAGGSVSTVPLPLLRGGIRGLCTREGFSLVARLCAYELNTLGVENGG